MLFLKMHGKIITVSVIQVDDKKAIEMLLSKSSTKEEIDIACKKGKTVFSETGVSVYGPPKSIIEVVDIEGGMTGETLVEYITMTKVSSYFAYPKVYNANDGSLVVYKVSYADSSTIYAKFPECAYTEDFLPKNLYLGEVMYDDILGIGDIYGRAYYVPTDDATILTKIKDEDMARLGVIAELKKEKERKNFEYYKLNLEEQITGKSEYIIVEKNRKFKTA